MRIYPLIMDSMLIFKILSGIFTPIFFRNAEKRMYYYFEAYISLSAVLIHFEYWFGSDFLLLLVLYCKY